MSAGRVLVINPNSTEAVTAGMQAAVADLAPPGGPAIECVTLAEGPPGVETERDVHRVVDPMCRLVERERPETRAFVIGCFSDPGLEAVREVTERPVVGICRAALYLALARAESVGVISILPGSVRRHWRLYRTLGIGARIAGDRAVGMGVLELEARPDAYARLLETGRRLRDEDGAEVLVLGCTGMAAHRARLERALARPVIEPTRAGTALALACLA